MARNAKRPKRGSPAPAPPHGIVGDCPEILRMLREVRRYARISLPVLVFGETGTGKELLAQAIHNDSPRADGPFVAVNCASIPESLIESELFGYEDGAFTGARKKRQHRQDTSGEWRFTLPR